MRSPSVVAVVDTNVLISGLIGKFGAPATILNALAERRFSLAISEPLLDELEIVTLRPEVNRRFNPVQLVELWRLIREGANTVVPVSRVVIADDPVDNALFTTALAARAACIVTGDQRVLDIGIFEGVRVISLREFLTWLAAFR